MTVARPAARPAARVRQRRGGDARRGRLRLASARSCAQMNRRARAARARPTPHYANPIGLDEPGNYSTARDLVKLAHRPAHASRSSASTVDSPAVHARRPATTRARSTTATRSCAATAGSTASRPATRAAPATCSSARPPQRRPARHRRARHAERGRARRRHAGAAEYGLRALPAITRRVPRAARGDARADPLPRAAPSSSSSPARTAPHGRPARPARRRRRSGRRTRPSERRGPDRAAASSSARVEVLQDGKRVATRAAGRRRRGPGRRPRADAPSPGSPAPLARRARVRRRWAVRSCWHGGAATARPAPAAREEARAA